MKTFNEGYSIIEDDGEFFIYDPKQDATVNRWGDIVAEGLFTMAEALATLDFLEGKSPAHDSELKTFMFVVDGTEYQAENYVDGIFINPVLPDNFWTEPMESRSEDHMKHWRNMPFILVNDGFYDIHCLDGGAWDRPFLIGGFDTQAKAIGFIKETYRK